MTIPIGTQDAALLDARVNDEDPICSLTTMTTAMATQLPLRNRCARKAISNDVRPRSMPTM